MFWLFFWHPVCNIFPVSFLHSIWHVFGMFFGIYSAILCGIHFGRNCVWHVFWHCIYFYLAFYLAFCVALPLAFHLTFCRAFCLAISLAAIACVPTDFWNSRLKSGSAHWHRSGGTAWSWDHQAAAGRSSRRLAQGWRGSEHTQCFQWYGLLWRRWGANMTEPSDWPGSVLGHHEFPPRAGTEVDFWRHPGHASHRLIQSQYWVCRLMNLVDGTWNHKTKVMHCIFWIYNVRAIKQKKLPKWSVSPDMVLLCGENIC